VTAKYGIHGSHKLQILHLGQFIYKHTHTNHALNASEAWSNSSEEEITLEEEKFATQTQVSSTNVLLYILGCWCISTASPKPAGEKSRIYLS